jgi:hypothetical protein
MLKKGSGLAIPTDNRGVGIAQFDQRLGYILGNRTSVFTKGAEDSRECLIKYFMN